MDSRTHYNSSCTYRQEAYFGYVKWQKKRGFWKKLFLGTGVLCTFLGTAFFLLFAFSKDPFLGYIPDDIFLYVHVTPDASPISDALRKDMDQWMGFEGRWNADARPSGWMVSRNGERAAFFKFPKDVRPELFFGGETDADFAVKSLGSRLYVAGTGDLVARLQKNFFARPKVFVRNILLAWKGRFEANVMVEENAWTQSFSASKKNRGIFGGRIFANVKQQKDGNYEIKWQWDNAENNQKKRVRFFETYPAETADIVSEGVAAPLAVLLRNFEPALSAFMNTNAFREDGWQWFASLEEGKDPSSLVFWRIEGAVPLEANADEGILAERFEALLRDIAATLFPKETPFFLPDGTMAFETVKDPTSFIFEEKDGQHTLQTEAGEFWYRIMEKENVRFLVFGTAFDGQDGTGDFGQKNSTANVCGIQEENQVFPFFVQFYGGIFQGKSNFFSYFREIIFNFNQKQGCLYLE